MSFKDKVVIVTGGANGIGREVAKQYAAQKAKVVVADLDDQGDQVGSELGDNALFLKTDVRKEEDVKRLVKETVDRFGRIDILINNAGVSRWKSPLELTIEEWDDVININLRGYFLCAREVAKAMKKNDNGGAIVNMASTRAIMSEIHSEAYAASKGGVLGLTHALAASLSSNQITVNAISPGWIETGDYQELREIDHEQHWSKRVGTPSDVARACLFLTNPDNSFINGENLVIDGGMTRKMIYES